jgi:cytochrome c biogenesis protein CcmG/thiol:disulfide interchange protein DsbE
MLRFLVPLAVFVVLVGFLWVGLSLKPREVPSPLIDKPAPPFRLPQLHQPERTFAPEEMKGKVWIFNVWASWCVACREEHPVLTELARSGIAPLYGLNYKDRRDDALAWLKRYGDPYVASTVDAEGRIGIDYGVYGVPETFLIDRAGVIRYKQIGPVTRRALDEKILPLIRELQKS